MEYRPLPKIVTRRELAPARGSAPGIRVDDTVDVMITKGHAKPFWRRYLVKIIDGELCRIVTPDGAHGMNCETKDIVRLIELQRLVDAPGEKAPNEKLSHDAPSSDASDAFAAPQCSGAGAEWIQGRVPDETGDGSFAASHGSETANRALADYLRSRRRAVESSVAAEALAGNEFKLACEKTALAEITALECWLGAGGLSPNVKAERLRP